MLGNDLGISRLGFGAMRITGRGVWGEPPDPTAARAVLRQAVELGVNFIDTADSYGPDVSERLIAEALHPYPADLVIATKGGSRRPGPGNWQPDGRPDHLRVACEGSLRRLRLEQIPLYQLHMVDASVPFAESIGTLAELRSEGTIRHIGLSSVTVEQIEQARAIVPVVSVQNRYNLVDRAAGEVLRHCERVGIAFICWSPLDRGHIARDTRRLQAIAEAHDAEPTQIALAWLLQRSPVTVPIPGTASSRHLVGNMAAGKIRLTTDEVAALDAYRPGARTILRQHARRSARRAVRFLRPSG
jgi:pyridoxine 4-dehydrogenase